MLDVDVSRRLGTFNLIARFASGPGITALFGRSGAGKTSVVNMIAGLLKPARGHIRAGEQTLFDSETGVDVPTRRRRVGYVFQDSLLFPHLSVRRNLDYARWVTRRVTDTIPFEQVVALLGIEQLLGRRPSTLSGGEKQRVAIGRALLAGPSLLLLDEPLASLDAARKAEILPYIERLRDEMRLPIIYVSHSLEEITRLADTVVMMAGGAVAAAGPVEQVMSGLDAADIADPFDAGAVVNARITAHDEAFELTTLAFDGGELRVPRIADAVGRHLRIRVLARDVVLATAPPQGLSIRNVLNGRVVEVREGAGPFAMVQIGVGGTHLLARITRHANAELALSAGKPVHALIKSVALDRRPLEDDGAAARAAARPIEL